MCKLEKIGEAQLAIFCEDESVYYSWPSESTFSCISYGNSYVCVPGSIAELNIKNNGKNLYTVNSELNKDIVEFL